MTNRTTEFKTAAEMRTKTKSLQRPHAKGTLLSEKIVWITSISVAIFLIIECLRA